MNPRTRHPRMQAHTSAARALRLHVTCWRVAALAPAPPPAPVPAASMLGCYNERDKNQLRAYKKTGPTDGVKEFKAARPRPQAAEAAALP